MNNCKVLTVAATAKKKLDNEYRHFVANHPKTSRALQNESKFTTAKSRKAFREMSRKQLHEDLHKEFHSKKCS